MNLAAEVVVGDGDKVQAELEEVPIKSTGMPTRNASNVAGPDIGPQV